MSDEQKGGALQSDGSTVASQQNSGDSTAQSQTKTEIQSKTVSWENHKSAIDDLHKFKKRAGELETKLSDLESQNLRAKEDWKTLAEKHKAEADKSKADYEKLNGYVITTQKLKAVTEAALVSGMRPEAIRDLELIPDFKGVDLDLTAKGNFVVSGAKEYVEALKNDRPHWFAGKDAPRVNGSGGGPAIPGQKKLTERDVTKAEGDKHRGLISPEELKGIYKAWDAQKQATQH